MESAHERFLFTCYNASKSSLVAALARSFFLMHRHSRIKIVRAHISWNSLYLSRGWHFVPLSFVSAAHTVLNDYSICVR